jgi:hypothetical protein
MTRRSGSPPRSSSEQAAVALVPRAPSSWQSALGPPCIFGEPGADFGFLLGVGTNGSSPAVAGGGAQRHVFSTVAVVDDLVAVCGWRCDHGASLARFLLCLAVAGFSGGVPRRGRQTWPTRSSCQKGNRAAGANEAAHLSKYRRPGERRYRNPIGVKPLEKCIRKQRDIAPTRRRVVACCRRPITMPCAHTSTPPPPPRLLPIALDLPIGRRARETVRDCRSSANRRGLCAPMAKVS